ncbi:MAG: HD domain-containing protein [Oligoflexia bacterium]|nr:HD domain-containing protein [Oligoflexia bacterium]
MKVLIVNGNDRERQIYSIYLDNLIDGLSIAEAYSCNMAKEVLANFGSEISLIIYTNNTNDCGLYPFIKDHYPNIPFVFLSPDLPEEISELSGFKTHNPKNDSIITPVPPNDFKLAVIKILKPLLVNKSLSAFQRVKLIHFLRFNRVLCDVFLKLSDQKYVKVFKENCKYTKEEIDKLRSKDVDYLYIKNSDFERFQVTFNKMPFLIFDTSKMSEQDIIDAISMTNLMLNHIINSMGFSNDAITLAEKSVEQTIKLIEKNKSLTNLIFEMRNKKDYLYDHSYLTTIVCCEILRQMDWSDDRNVDQLCMASLLHDITLTNSDLALVLDQNDPELKKFSKEDIKNYIEHPTKICTMLEKIDFVPTEVINIIHQHHEAPQGGGFPERIRAMKLPVLSCTFILAHTYVKKIYRSNFDYQKNNEIVFELKKDYDVGNFKPLLDAFIKFHQENRHLKSA